MQCAAIILMWCHEVFFFFVSSQHFRGPAYRLTLHPMWRDHAHDQMVNSGPKQRNQCLKPS